MLSSDTMTVEVVQNQQSSCGKSTYLSQILKYPVGKRCCQQYWSSSVWKTFSLCFSEEMWPCHCFSLLQFFPHIQQWKSTWRAQKTRVPSAGIVCLSLWHVQGPGWTGNHPRPRFYSRGARLVGEPGKDIKLKSGREPRRCANFGRHARTQARGEGFSHV